MAKTQNKKQKVKLIEILITKLELWTKVEILSKNRNFGQKSVDQKTQL